MLKANLPSTVLTGAAGEREHEQQRCLVESTEDLMVFADCVPWGQVLFSGAAMGWNPWRHCRVAQLYLQVDIHLLRPLG